MAVSEIDNSWAGLLHDGEELLWQGQPVAKPKLEDINWGLAAMGAFFVGFSLFWMTMAAQAGGFFWMFGLIFFFVGLRNSVGQWILDPWLRQQTYYSLTNQRAFIASRSLFKGKTLKSYRITATTPLELQQGATDSIYFATEERRRNKGGTYTVQIGFEHLPDSAEPYRLLEQIRKGAA